jgi:hypothetical protein
MNSHSWKVAILGPTGVVLEGSVVRLLYSFPTQEEAEEQLKKEVMPDLPVCDTK